MEPTRPGGLGREHALVEVAAPEEARATEHGLGLARLEHEAHEPRELALAEEAREAIHRGVGIVVAALEVGDEQAVPRADGIPAAPEQELPHHRRIRRSERLDGRPPRALAHLADRELAQVREEQTLGVAALHPFGPPELLVIPS